MDEISFTVIGQRQFGVCQKCRKDSIVNTIEVVDGDKTSRTLLCPECGNKLYALVQKKNRERSEPRLDNRWFVADSELISEVFADSFTN